jgi:GR25 family glycosyltransferase involved in LPS biosynthesis
MLHKYFDKVFLINLKRRPDRLEQAKKECEKIGLEYELFEAIDGDTLNIIIENKSLYWNKAALGILLSNYNIIKIAKEKNYKSILILEDDIEFDSNFISILEKNWSNIPSNWETFFLGTNHIKKPIHVIDDIYKITSSYSLHCYAIKSTVYDIFLNAIRYPNKPIDEYMANVIHPRGFSYCISPAIAYQKASYSDILKRNVDYAFLRK